ncbi:venom acid phosphatase Acph-1 isoform X2 [Aethina tumida]|uniref:venom acid phosphatase Acph-1 isoform X2 n=1 Tax=Aethina tumida TaxID=116153 RepID=UPI00096B2FC4|nr:venom acid phosphatase Acph-1 isoform X2 [Aethina tumida]
MSYILVSIFVLLGTVRVYELKPMSDQEASTLRLVHILFRHGDRTNVSRHSYPNDPFKNETYHPFGPGELTKKGKIKSLRLGKALRERYDKFLGKDWNSEVVEAWSSDTGRSKMTLLLVLARLFPPQEEEILEEGLNWQPIPYSHKPLSKDNMFFGIINPNFKKLYSDYEQGNEVQTTMNDYKDIIEFIKLHAGYKNPTLFDMFALYGTLLTQKVVDECKLKISGKMNENRKIYLYSGHDVNIGHLLNTLEVYKPHIPPYNAYFIFELHEIEGVYGVKLFYQDYSSREPQLLQLPGCEDFCPFDQFVNAIKEYFPEKNENTCVK